MKDTRTRPPVVPRQFLIAIEHGASYCPQCRNEISATVIDQTVIPCRAHLPGGQACGALCYITPAFVKTLEGTGILIVVITPDERKRLDRSGLSAIDTLKLLGIVRNHHGVQRSA